MAAGSVADAREGPDVSFCLDRELLGCLRIELYCLSCISRFKSSCLPHRINFLV